ncbi:MAG: acetylornithine transaminase [Desulfuromonadales bacterium]|nr:acetylornithine transaminase [Desulfuromonadales bacterium]
MNTEKWIEKSDKYIMKTYGRYPIVPVRGKGCKLWDVDGKEYLDFLGGVAVNNLGHCHSNVVKAIQEQATTLIHCSNYYQIPQQIELAELLCSLSFADKAFFCNSGAEANEAAIKLARKYSRDKTGKSDRYGIITATDSFHGRTLATVSATGQEKIQRFFDPLLHGFTHVAFDDVAAIEAAITDDTCAVMLEPIQGEGGVNVPSPGYLAGVRELCNKYGLLLILDEVQVGMGRTGKLFAYEHFGITPDIITLAKALAGGVPIGAMLATDDVATAFSPGTHGSTFGGNPLATAAALAAVRTIVEEGILNSAEEMGEYLVGELETLHKKYPVIIKEVRGIGLMIGMALTIPGGDIVKAGHERGVLLNTTHDTVLRFVPPLIVSKQEVNEMIRILDGILKEITV